MGIIKFIKAGALTIALFAIANFVFSNDTIKLSRPTPILKLKGTFTNGAYFINKKNILVPEGSNLFDYLNTEKLTSNEVFFGNSTFDDLADFVYIDQSFRQINKNIHFAACNINNLLLRGADTCRFEFGKIRNLIIESVSMISMSSIVLQENLSIDRSKNLSLDLHNFSNSGHLKINITNSSINEFICGLHRFDSSLVINFEKDTIKENIHLWNNDYRYAALANRDPIGINYNKNWGFYIYFKDCYFDSEFSWLIADKNAGIPNTKIIFDGCTFGPNANLSSLLVDHLIIRDCKISQVLPLSFFPGYSKVRLQILNSNIDNIKIDMSGKDTILLDTTGGKEDVSHMFRMLLEKFTKEARFESYKRTDIQYRKFANSAISNLIQEKWWYYGYRKDYVFSWTIFFVLLFFTLNLLAWKQMQNAYPIIPNPKVSFNEKGIKSTAKHLSLVFLFTVFIFFSIGISFSKINYTKLRYVFFFFFQYLLGLFCLFFIFRAIIKF